MSAQYFEMIDNGIVIEDDQSHVNLEERIAMASFNYCGQLVIYAKGLKFQLYTCIYTCLYEVVIIIAQTINALNKLIVPVYF